MTQHILDIDSPFFLREQHLAGPADLTAAFAGNGPLSLEIGCGLGDFMIELAERHPDRNFLAIDIYNKGCLKTCKKIEAAGLENVRVMRIEARYLMARYLSEHSLAAVYINCPDPWPKKRHRRRRLVNGAFLQNLLHYLQPAGELFFSSDFQDYAEQVAEELSNLRGYENQLQRPLVTDLPGYPLSNYMRRFLQLGQPIHYLHYRKTLSAAADSAPAPLGAIQPGFRVAWSQPGHA